jgi:asparagine synthase (glutamine-hydrolysing)
LTGLFGWFGRLRPDLHAARAASLMAAASGEALKETTWGGDDRFGLGVVAVARPGSLCTHRGVSAAIAGSPWWSDPCLARIAADHGHARAVVEAYRAHAASLIRHLHGSFALALADPEAARALLAVDRFGIEPLRYTRTPDGLVVFGSTTESVCAHPSTNSSLSIQSIHDFFYADTIFAPATIYEAQKKLCSAQLLEVSKDKLSATTYWRMPYVETDGASMETMADALRSSLRTAVRRTLIGENADRVGSFLSGGLDSSTVLGLLHQALGGPVSSFTVGFTDAGFDETHYARIAARHFNARHYIYTLTDGDAFSIIERVATAFDEPFLNLSCIPVYFCARLARDSGIEMLAAGDGGDELFAGNKHYLWSDLLDRYHRLPRLLRAGAIEPLLFGSPLVARLPVLRTLRHWVGEARQPMPERRSAGNFCASDAFLDMWSADARQQIDPLRPLTRMREIYYGAPTASPLRRYLSLDHQIVLADNDLRKVGRMCELAGVRVRFPLLDDDVASMAARVPPHLLICGRRLRYLYKRALADFLPNEVLTKKKHGFGPPYLHWIRRHRPLYELANDSIRDIGRRGFFRSEALQRVRDRPRDGSAPHLDDLAWQLMWLELWLRAHERPVAARAPDNARPLRSERAHGI